jgi:hypothetical protein
MTLSVVIPTWSGTQELADMAYGLCKKVKPMCDELIVTEDAGNYYKELQEISDLYLMHPNIGDVPNSNLGMRVAKGDYIAVINSDIEIGNGDLRALCIPGKTVCPAWIGGLHNEFVGHFFVVARTVIDQYGYLDETLPNRGAGADFKWYYTIQRTYQWSDALTYKHQGNVSYREFRKQSGIAEPLNSDPNWWKK